MLNQIRRKLIDKSSYLIFGIIFKIILDLSFCGPLQTYYTSFPLDISTIKVIISYISIIFMVLLLPDRSDLESTYISIILYYIIIPVSTIYSYMNTSSGYYISLVSIFSIIELFTTKIRLKTIKIEISHVNISKVMEFASIIFILITAVVFFIFRGMPTLEAFNLYDIYELRSSYSLPSWVSAMFNISSKTLIPFTVSILLKRKKYISSVLFLIIQLLFYLWLGNKLTLLSLAIIPAVYFLTRKKTRSVNMILVILLAIVSFVSLLPELVQSTSGNLNRAIIYIYGLLVRRNIFVPAYLKTCYYDFFVVKGNPIVGFFGTIIAPIMFWLGFEYPYQSEYLYTRAIGHMYANDSNANTGVFGRELAHFGFFGIFVAAICLLLLLYAIRCSEKRNGQSLVLCFTIYNILLLSNSGVFDIFSISPLLVMLFILFLYDENDARGKIEAVQSLSV